MKKISIFTGPTLAAAEGRAILDATYLPPVRQGDVYRAALEAPWAIGIIDGCFESVPAVCHKEILWAMAQGIHVFGCSSMGALRAAELEAFGMEGVGPIYEALKSGALEDDDEVTIIHAPAEEDYRPLSEAMVNIRATLEAATKAGVVEAGTRSGLERLAKELFYAERSYPALLRRAASAGLPAPELEALRAWLPQGRVDQKREDALAMLKLIRARLEQDPAPKSVRFTFAHTDLWESVQHRARAHGANHAPPAERSTLPPASLP